MKKVLSLVMILILSLTACGGKGGGASDDPNLGKYIGEEYSGDGSNWFSLSEIFDEGESYIELKDGGSGNQSSQNFCNYIECFHGNDLQEIFYTSRV